MKYQKILITIHVALLMFACQKEEQWHALLDKDLSGWETFLGIPDSSVQNLNLERNPEGKYTDVLGVNMDPKSVFTTDIENGETVLRISGEIFGGISTLQEFENYHLKMKVKWGEKKWPPRDQQKRDSGVLYHCTGEHGVTWGFWMRSQEFQVQEGDFGDYWSLAESRIDIPSVINQSDSAFVYNAEAPLRSYGYELDNGLHCKKSDNFEKPNGEWNTIEIICVGDRSLHIVNGSVVMALSNSRFADGNTDTPLTKGKLQIQSEGAEVFYKDIRIKNLPAMPDKYETFFRYN